MEIASALVVQGAGRCPARQAELTFAIARHAVVDLAQILGTAPVAPVPDRLPAGDRDRLRRQLATAGLVLDGPVRAGAGLDELRRLYEPYVNALARHLLMPLPTWGVAAEARDNWRTTAWEPAPRPPRLDPS